jgi:hypothetical protein
MADRWIISDFAFNFGGTSTVAPYFQCFAVSQTSEPVAGGWFLYALRTDDASHVWLNDYPKFGVWPDGIYMSVNGFSNAGLFQGTEAWALNRYDMESGLPLRAFVAYIANTTDPFAMVPSNLRGNTPGSMPPAGTPNYFVSESQTAFAIEVRKFQVAANWSSATFSAATNVGQTSYTIPGQNIVPQPGTAVTLDSLGDRIMQKVHYRKVGGAESLWVSHTFRASSSGPTGSQWAQINVSGGTVSTTAVQQQKFDPADTVYRWMSSIAADNAGNAALGYSASSAGVNPSLRYAGRLASDGLNSLAQTETVMQAGVGVQNGKCGGSDCHRWGDYSAMSVDPGDDCTFWFTSEYYAAAGTSTIAWNTRIGTFRFSPAQCVSTPVTLTTHSLIFDGGVGSDWSPVSERLGTSGIAPNAFDYFLTWDSTNLYAGMKGLSNTLPYTFALVIDTDPATQSPSNTGSMAALACAGGFNANAKGNFALLRSSANSTAATAKFQASGGAWTAWAPGSGSDALDFGRNMAEFQLNWSDVGLSASAGTAGIYLFVCQGNALVSSWPPEDLQSGSPILNVETTVPLNDTGRTPRTYSPHAGQETATLTNGAGPFNLLNGYVQLANISGLSGACSFAAVDGGNLTSAPAAQMAQRTYTLSPGAGCTGLTADVTLKYEDGTTANNAPSEINGLTEANLTLFKNIVGSWVDQGGTVNTTTNTVTRLAVNSFSQWGFGTSHPTAVSVTNVSAEGETGYAWWLPLGAAASAIMGVRWLRRRRARG